MMSLLWPKVGGTWLPVSLPPWRLPEGDLGLSRGSFSRAARLYYIEFSLGLIWGPVHYMGTLNVHLEAVLACPKGFQLEHKAYRDV